MTPASAIAALTLLFCAGLAPAQQAGTLDKIKKNGVVTLGVRDGSVPFSYLDDKQQ